MPERVVWHVGLPKSGTTYLQTILWNNRATLREHGVLLPGNRMFDHNLLATRTRSERPGPRARDAWDRMLDEVADWPGTVVLSNEWFSLTDKDRAADALAALDRDRGRTSVVVTARDPLALAPAAWQETLKLGRATSLPDFVEALDQPRDRWSWWSLDPAEVLDRWAATLSPTQAHVVTLPGRGAPPDELWHRFAAVVGIERGACDLTRTTANESLGAESARLLELLGPRLREAVGADDAAWTVQYRWLRRYLGHQVLVPRGGSRIRVPEPTAGRLRERARATRAALQARGYAVSGDLADLTAATVTADSVDPASISDTDLLAVASDVVVALLARLAKQGARPTHDGEASRV